MVRRSEWRPRQSKRRVLSVELIEDRLLLSRTTLLPGVQESILAAQLPAAPALTAAPSPAAPSTPQVDTAGPASVHGTSSGVSGPDQIVPGLGVAASVDAGPGDAGIPVPQRADGTPGRNSAPAKEAPGLTKGGAAPGISQATSALPAAPSPDAPSSPPVDMGGPASVHVLDGGIPSADAAVPGIGVAASVDAGLPLHEWTEGTPVSNKVPATEALGLPTGGAATNIRKGLGNAGLQLQEAAHVDLPPAPVPAAVAPDSAGKGVAVGVALGRAGSEVQKQAEVSVAGNSVWVAPAPGPSGSREAASVGSKPSDAGLPVRENSDSPWADHPATAVEAPDLVGGGVTADVAPWGGGVPASADLAATDTGLPLPQPSGVDLAASRVAAAAAPLPAGSGVAAGVDAGRGDPGPWTPPQADGNADGNSVPAAEPVAPTVGSGATQAQPSPTDGGPRPVVSAGVGRTNSGLVNRGSNADSPSPASALPQPASRAGLSPAVNVGDAVKRAEDRPQGTLLPDNSGHLAAGQPAPPSVPAPPALPGGGNAVALPPEPSRTAAFEVPAAVAAAPAPLRGAGEAPAEEIDLSPQAADLIAGCAPFRTGALEQVFQQVFERLGNLGEELSDLLAEFAISPWVFPALVVAVGASEVARRQLRKPSPRLVAVDGILGVLPEVAS